MRRIISIAIAVYLLLVLIDRFLLIELLFQRVAIPFVFAIAATLACIGAGYLARRTRNDIALNFVVGYPIFGTICFLVGLLHISAWTMVPIVGILGGIGLLCVAQALLPVRAAEGGGGPLVYVALALVGIAGL